jgi:hypothetical protein
MKHIKNINEMFKIGNPINIQNPTNVYKLLIENMSGDADAYHNSETLIPKEYEPLIKDIIELCNWAQKDWPRRDVIQDKYDELKSNHSKFFEEEHDDSFDPIITRDVTTDGEYICRPKFKRLTWFDENGIEYQVHVK